MKRQNRPASPGDRLPPHAIEAEQGVLACALVAPEETLNELEEREVSNEWFYELRHQTLFSVLMEMHRAGTPVDSVTLTSELRNRNLFEQCGGSEYVYALPDRIPSAHNLPYYLDELRDKHVLRALVKAGTEMAAAAFNYHEDQTSDPQELLARSEREILRLSEQGGTERRISAVVDTVMVDLENYHRGHAQMKGITTGIEYLDKLLCGFGGENGNYVVISARPSLGKTSFATQVALHAAIDYVYFKPVMGEDGRQVVEGDKPKFERKVGVAVGVFSLEMSAKALVSRMLFQRASADMQRWRTGFAESADFPPITKAAGELMRAPIFIDDTPRCTIESLKAKARRMHRQHHVGLFIVDYIQLMRAGTRFREDRVQELAQISGELQALGKELNVPFIVLAQMNRDYEKDPNRRPRLSDLKDCGSIEQDADVVGFLYTPKIKQADEDRWQAAMEKVFETQDWSKYPSRVNCIIAKNRYGPTGDSNLLFQRSCTKFFDYYAWLEENTGERPLPQQQERYADANAEREPLPTNDDLNL